MLGKAEEVEQELSREFAVQEEHVMQLQVEFESSIVSWKKNMAPETLKEKVHQGTSSPSKLFLLLPIRVLWCR